ncbi:MAG: hypothetical protein GVY07_01755 [Bacteroidetes bacterium]|nr:hypothetical protein [Bacteroidota bacterium]
MEKLTEMNRKEMRLKNGGKLVNYTPVGIAVWLGYEIISNWSDVKSGIKDGLNDGIEFLESFNDQ